MPLTGSILIDDNGNITGNVQPVINPQPPQPSPTPAWADPASVLVIVQDNTGPEPGTGGKNASQFVADHYMQVRGIPAQNLVHIATYIEAWDFTTGQGAGRSCTPGGFPQPHDPTTDDLGCLMSHSSSVNISNALCQSEIAAPVLAALSGPLKGKIKYIVPVYGVPTLILTAIPGSALCSVDSALAALLQPNPNQIALPNAFHGSTVHIDASTSNVLLVSRLDGPSAVASAALVDKAIAGETAGVKGVGYFDYGPSAPLGSSTLNAYNLCVAAVPPQTCLLNDQSVTGHMIQSAPNCAWAWGGYDLGAANAAAYSFVPGAVAAQMNSNSANCIRAMCPGSYAAAFLAQGVTGTWGAVAEPFTAGYATGDALLNALWRGFTYGEAAYIANPLLNWQMMFVGDPLYRPLLK